jgi:putative lipoic acid-binding regulatory protein
VSEDVFGGQPLRFPVDCHYKIIAEDTEDVRVRIEIVLQELGISARLLQGNHSSQGKYVTFNFDWTLQSKEEMDLIDARLRVIPGVRVVL